MLKKIVVTLLFVLGIIVFGEVPHSYIWENPDKEVTQTETLKRHKDKAELNISVTKLKSEPIPMKHDVDNKKIYFELTSEAVKRSDESIKLEPTDRIFVSEKLEEVPSVSTTNGRKKINGLKRLNKSLDKGTLKNGNLTWTVKDLMTVETKKIVEINYGMFPKSLYVGVTDKDYNLKKIFVSKMEDLALYNANDLAGYVSKYDEDTQISNGYDHDISDILMWGKDQKYVDIKLAEVEIASIADKTLIDKKPYLAVSNQTVTLTGKNGGTITGTLHIRDRSVQPFSLVEEEEKPLSKVMVVMNLDGKTTRELKTAYYVRLNGAEFKNLKADTYTVGGSIVYGHNGGISQLDVPKIILTNGIIAKPKNITLDFWVFGTDFTDKVNYIIDPRLNGTGNLKIRAQDEEAPLDNSVSAGNTDSVFDMTGRLAKFDFDDTTEVTVQNISGFTPTKQNGGSFFSNKNRWAEGTIPGYKVRARVWTDFDGIEIDFEKTSALSPTNDGVRKFKVIHKHTKTGKVIQEITVNLYVNNVRIQDRAGYNNVKRSDISLSRKEGTVPTFSNYFTEVDKKGQRAKTGNTKEEFGSYYNVGPFKIQMIGKKDDLKEYFPIMTSKGIYMYTSALGTRQVKLSASQLVITHSQLIGRQEGDWYIAQTDGNGLSTLSVVHQYQKPIALVIRVGGIWMHWYDLVANPEDGWQKPYITYGNGKRRLESVFRIRVIDWETPPPVVQNYTTTIRGVPLLGNVYTGENHFFKGIVWDSFNENAKSVPDNEGWVTNNFDKSMFGQARYTLGGYFDSGSNTVVGGQNLINLWIGNNSPNYAKVENFSHQSDNLIYNRRRDIKQPYLGIGIALRKWTMSKQLQDLGVVHQEGGATPQNIGKGEYERFQLYFKIEPFDARFLYDRAHSSIKEAVLKNIDMDFSPGLTDDKIKGQVIKIGEVYFRHLNVKALRQNTTNKPRFVLPDTAYLVYRDGSNPGVKIPVDLSFSEINKNDLSFEMVDKGGNYAGENGKTVYLHISDASARQIYKNGKGVRYQVKGNFQDHGWGITTQTDTPEVIKVGVVATTSPNGGVRNEPFSNWVTNVMVLETAQFKPNVFSVNFQGNQPLVKAPFYMLGKEVKFEPVLGGYNYESGIQITNPPSAEQIGVAKYQHEIKQHRYQVTDGTGRMRSGEISSGGSGAYWDNLVVGANKVTIYHTRDGQANRDATFMKIEDWNYEAGSGKITKKHYKPYSTVVNQYFDITVNFPDFDPYIYYDDIKIFDPALKPIKIGEKFEIQRVGGKKIYPLGTVSTKGYNVDITKKGGEYAPKGQADPFGLRVVPNNRGSANAGDIKGVVVYELDDNGNKVKDVGRARIVFLNDKGEELGYNIGSPNYMLAGNQSARVGLVLPNDLKLEPGKDYKIEGKTGSILDKYITVPSNFNLIIGRNGYFKEIIGEIVLKRERLEGSFALEFDNNYTIREMVKFKSTTFAERAPIDIEPIVGARLTERYKEGILQMESGDILQMEIEGKTTNLEVLEDLSSKKIELLLQDKVTKMSVKIEDGKLRLGLNYWKNRTINMVLFRIFRKGVDVMYQKGTIVTPRSQFIVTHKEDLDFGNVFQGTKNNYAEAKLEIENTGNIADVKFEISDTTPTLENVNDDTKTLKVREINGALFQKEPKKYEMRVNGFLDVPEKATIGEYKGSITIKLYIK